MSIDNLSKATSLVMSVHDWTDERGFLPKQSLAKAVNKVGEEIGEISSDLARSNEKHLRDSIGDTLVTIINAYRKAHDDSKANTLLLAKIIADRDQVENPTVDHDLVMLSLYEAFGKVSQRTKMVTLGLEVDDLGFTNLISVLGMLAHGYDLTLLGCLEIAYDEIKDRKGSAKNGVFVKESDEADLRDHDDAKDDKTDKDNESNDDELTDDPFPDEIHINVDSPEEAMKIMKDMIDDPKKTARELVKKGKAHFNNDSDDPDLQAILGDKLDPQKAKEMAKKLGSQVKKRAKITFDGVKKIANDLKHADD